MGGGRSHLVKWEMVLKLVERASLGIGSLRMHNKALLDKRLWRILLEYCTFGYRMTVSGHGSHASEWISSGEFRDLSENLREAFSPCSPLF